MDKTRAHHTVSDTGSPREGEDRRIADELDAVLRDDDLWLAIESSRGKGKTRDELARRAVGLYRLTSPILAQRFAESPAPATYALGALRDVADACAIVTRPWPARDRAGLPITRRADVETIVRQFGIEEWANSLGVDLLLQRAVPEDVDAAPHGEAADWDDFSNEGLAGRWASTVRTFRTAARLRSTGDAEARADVQGRVLRDGAPAYIALSRMWLIWARQFSETEDVIAVAASLVFAAQGCFGVCWDLDEEDAFFPDDEFLREFLQLEGGTAWLRDHDAEVPVELEGGAS